MAQLKYDVIFEEYTRRHFIKAFEKAYKNRWGDTMEYIVFMCEHIDTMLQTKRADFITGFGNKKIVKLDFAINGLKISPKSSGNRCILLVDDDSKKVSVLLVYSKNDIPTKGETAAWKRIIKNEYMQLLKGFNL